MASTSTPNKRERESPLINLTDDTSVNLKRLRTAKLEPASYLPPQIACLPHVTERIEAMATSLEEAITIAASTGQAAKLENLLNKFHDDVYDLAEAIIAAASNGDLKCLEVFGEFFLDSDYDEEHLVTNDGRQIMSNGLIPAARNGLYDVVDYLLYISTDRDVGAGDLVFEAFGEAIAHGHYHILQLIREETLLYRGFAFYQYPRRSPKDTPMWSGLSY